jgi:hypothetical protein
MAVGLIKKQIIHSGGGGVTTSPPRSPLKGKKKEALKSAQRKLRGEMRAFKEQEYVNPYESAQNLMEGMENVYEDLTVNQQQAQFEKQMAQQQQANIMQGMAGGAGGSGVAGLAQAMSGQGQIQAQRAAASIGQQEQRVQMAAAGGAERVQAAERGGAMQVQQMKLGGEQMLQQMEMDRQATLLGVAQAEVQGAQQAIAANQQMWGSIVGGVIGAAGAVVGGGLAGK